jgi:hypothetical protein
MKWLKIISSFITVTSFFSFQLASSLAQVFSCIEAGNGKSVLKQDAQTPCYDQAWKSYVVFVVFALIAYFVVLPGCLVWKFRELRKQNDRATIKQIFDPLIKSYREGSEWYELVKTLFRLGLVVIRDMLTFSISAKVVFLGLLLMVLLFIETETRPYVETLYQTLSIL